jgi:hypothetical protein
MPPGRASASASTSPRSTPPDGSVGTGPTRFALSSPESRPATLPSRRRLCTMRHCRACQNEHHTDHARLRSIFDARALALLPFPASPHTLAGLFDRLEALLGRAMRAVQRVSMPHGGGRERMIEAAAGTGATAKIAASAISIVVLASSTIGATHALGHYHRPQHPHSHAHHRPIVQPVPSIAPVVSHRTRSNHRPHSVRGLGHTERVPGGFAYLGVPPPPKRSTAPVVKQRGGGPFGP